MIEIAAWLLIVAVACIWLGVVFVGPPYVPTLKRDMEVVFSALKLGKNNHLVDLGAGDGRVLKLAAEKGARVSGVEINPFLVLIAHWRLRRYKGSVMLGNMWRYRLPDTTTHVFAFSAEVFLNKLEKYLVSERTHTNQFWLLCYGFQLKGRKPEKIVGAFNCYRF